MSVSDNEWAAGVMGWTRHPTFPSVWVTYSHAGFFNTRSGGDWNPDTDANDFRDLLRCEAVKEAAKAFDWMTPRDFFSLALIDQPTALRRLREEMEEQE